MKLVRQTDYQWEGGCAVACVAMLANVSFDTAGKALYPDWIVGTKIPPSSNRRVLRAMRNLKLRIRQVFVDKKDRKKLKLPALPTLFTCDFGHYRDRVHCVVWDPKQQTFLDPASWIDTIDCCNDSYYYYTKSVTDYILVLGKRK